MNAIPVQFSFERLSIRGFRGIRRLDLDLPVNKPLHVIGSNNSGKTTLLNALAVALGGGGFHRFAPVAFDFFHDGSDRAVSDFTVTLRLRANDESGLPAVQGVGNPTRVHAIEVRGTTDSSGTLKHQRVLLDSEGKPILLSYRTPLKGAAKREFAGMGLGYRRFYARLENIRDHLPDVWLLTPQNLYRSLYEWRTGPLQRLSRMLAEQFLESEWQFEFEDGSRPMPATLIKAHAFFRESVEAFPFWKGDLKPRLQETLAQYVGGQARFALHPDVQHFKDWLAQQLAVSFAADTGGATTPLQRMGDGWQSLVRLAALDVLSQYPGQVARRVVLLVEEPETHLHPHLRRKMRNVLERLAAERWLVVTATHGPEFTSLARPQVVAKLWRKGDDVALGTFDTSGTSNAIKFQEKLDERGNHEMLFAQRAVLCEGKDDCWALRSAIQKLDPTLDLDARSVSLVDTGGAGNLKDYANIAQQLGIPWCAITDEDKLANGQVNPLTEKVRRALDAKRGANDQSVMWPDNLEACLGAPVPKKATPDWQAANIDPKPLTQMKRDHPAFMAECARVLSWIVR